MKYDGKFYGHLVYFTAILYILSPFGIFYIHLVYFISIWYILSPFGIFYLHLVYFISIWYILWLYDHRDMSYMYPVLLCCTKKNIANQILTTSTTILISNNLSNLF
jgi:hypothetical protein